MSGQLKNSLPGKPLISVITVVFNGASTLEHTIQSVLEQTYDNVEHIIIDGGSTDGTLDIVRKYEDRIDYWLSEKDAGIYDGMNKGFSLARGKYVGTLNSDDYLAAPDVMELMAGVLEASQVDAVFSGLDVVDPENRKRVLRRYRVSRLTPFMLRLGLMPAHPTFYCRKACYEQAGFFRTDYRIAADFEMLARLLLKQHISWKFINRTTVKMRAGGLSSRDMKSSWILNREIVRACRDNGLYTNILILALKLPIRMLERIS